MIPALHAGSIALEILAGVAWACCGAAAFVEAVDERRYRFVPVVLALSVVLVLGAAVAAGTAGR